MKKLNRKIKVAIYCRVGSEEQLEVLKMQEISMESYAQQKNYEISDVYCDYNYSGNDFSRPSLQLLMADLKANKLDAVLVSSIDRLFRNTKDLIDFYENTLRPFGKKLIVGSKDVTYPNANDFIFSCLAKGYKNPNDIKRLLSMVK